MDYLQSLRYATLKITDGKPVQERADALNLLEMILDGEMSVEQMVDAIGSGTVKERYRPRTPEG